MSLKAELEVWANALSAYDKENFEQALSLFSRIADSSKILTNMGLIYATLGEHETAVDHFILATDLDQYLAVAYFQCGVSNFLLGRYELASRDFDEALLFLRGNQAINYEQLGLKFKLFSAEVLFNKGLAQIYLGQIEDGLMDLEDARQEKVTVEHNVIDEAIQDRGEGYTVFSVPVGVLYRPSQSKLTNSMSKDYLGKAKLVAASDGIDSYTNFSGAARLKAGITPAGVFLEDSPEGPGLQRSATVPPPPKKDVGAAQPEKSLLLRSNTRLNTVIDASRPTGSPLGRRNTSGSADGLSSGSSTSQSIRRPGLESKNRPQKNGPQQLSAIQERNRRPRREPREYFDSDAEGTLPSENGSQDAAPARSSSRSRNRDAPSSTTITKPGLKVKKRAPTLPSRAEEDGGDLLSRQYREGPPELRKIKVKLYYQGDVRGMAFTPDTTFQEFLERVTTKFGKGMQGLSLKFQDEDGGQITLQDESDYELAIETARENAKGKLDGKLEIWCQDV